MLKVVTFPGKTRFKRGAVDQVRLALSRGQTVDWLLIAVLSSGAFALALAHPWSHAYIGDAQYGDAAYWDFAGENWARGYFTAKSPDIRPGYSVFLGLIYVLVGADFHYAFVAQALLYAATAGLVFSIGKMIRGRLAGTLAAALLVLDPYMWEWVATSTTELLGSFANLVAVYFLVRGCRRGASSWNLALFGMWLAIANVVRPVTLAFAGPAVLCLLLLRPAAWRRRFRDSAVAVAGVMLGLLPGVLYQYAMTGDPGLSSNTAANLFAASSPTYLTWTPAIYDDVSRDLQARGIAPTAENTNAEFTRLTIQNYLQYPGFQVGRIVDGFRLYSDFEGEATRPERFIEYRPILLALGVASVLALAAVQRALRWWAVAPSLALLVGLGLDAERTLKYLQLASLGLPLIAPVAFWRDPRRLGWLLVGLFWMTTGLFAILSTGIVGFFLDRLYTQVEPVRAVLLALAAVELSAWLLAGRRGAAVLQAKALIRGVHVRLPAATRLVAVRVAGVGALVVVAGLVRLASVNLQSPDSALLTTPSADELTAAARRWGLPGPVTYITGADFPAARALLTSGMPPPDTTVYAVPGEYTRFLWHLSEQDRTLFWYVFSDRTRPLALDTNLLTGEATGDLPISRFGNRTGLLFIAPTSAYFDHTGIVMLQNVLTVRAFAPLDPQTRRFRLDDAQVFPMTTPLYDETHVNAAVHDGSVTDSGPLRLSVDGPLLRTLTFRPFDSADPGREAVVTFRNIWIPPGSEFRTSVALPIGLRDHDEVGRTRVEVAVSRPGQSAEPVIEYVLDPTAPADFSFVPVSGDLGQFAGQTIDIRIRVIANPYSTAAPEVIFGEPRILMR